MPRLDDRYRDRHPDEDRSAEEIFQEGLEESPDGGLRARDLRPVTEEELRAIVNYEIDDAHSFATGKLSRERQKALQYYFGDPFGNEVQGRSQVILTEVRDVVEWIMPALMKVFASGHEIVAYEPRGPEDLPAAKQATDYGNWAFLVNNPGFRILDIWFRDALVQKLGTIKHWYERSQRVERESYEGLSELQMAELLSQPDVQPIEHTVRGESTQMEGMPAEGQAMHDLTILRSYEEGHIRIENIAPEDFRVNREAKNLEEALFIQHRIDITRQELLELGYPAEVVDAIPADSSGEFEEEEVARETVDDEPSFSTGNRRGRRQIVHLSECYLRVDMDGDEIAEWIKVTVVGDNQGDILDWEPLQGTPLDTFSTITPIPVAHRLYGLSLADLTEDLQLINSTILRQFLDNLYLANNSRMKAVEGEVNLDDLLTSVPGGPIRVRRMDALEPIPPTIVAPSALPALEYLNSVKERRTGITSYNQGLDANTLNKTATGITRIMEAASQRIEYIARIFAETGMRNLFRAIQVLAMRHDARPRMVRLRNEFIEVDPSGWRQELDVQITVGIGTGSRAEQAQKIVQLMQVQRDLHEAAPGLLVGPDQVYQTAKRLTETLGFKAVQDFFHDPGQGPATPPEPSPEAQAAQAELQQKQQELALKQRESEQKLALEERELAAKISREERELAAKLELEQRKVELDHQRKIEELALKRVEIERRAELSPSGRA